MAPTFFPPAIGLQPVYEEYLPADHWLRRLCLAILADVLKDLGGFGSCGGRVARARYGREAWDWVQSDTWYCFSFSLVCAVLELDREAVRCHIRHRFAPEGVLRNDLAHLSRSPGRSRTSDVPAPHRRESGKYQGRGLRSPQTAKGYQSRSSR
jgi:hypothetical protein